MLSIMNTVAKREKRSSIRDAIVGVAIVLLIGFEVVAFSKSSSQKVQANAVQKPIPAQVETPTAPEQPICTPESVAVVC